MKIIVIGLGNFGSLLAVRLTDMGHEVIGVDTSTDRVDSLKSKLSTTICLDAGKIESLAVLPIVEVDLIIIAIGTNFASAVQTVAALRQSKAKRIIARAMNSLHIGVFQTLGVERVIFVEKDAAELLSQSLSLSEFVSSYRVDAEHYVVQFIAPKAIVGKTIIQSELESKFNLKVITIKRSIRIKNILGLEHSERAAINSIATDTTIEEGDVIVTYSKLKDYDAFTRSIR